MVKLIRVGRSIINPANITHIEVGSSRSESTYVYFSDGTQVTFVLGEKEDLISKLKEYMV